jgi:hypothetical protein
MEINISETTKSLLLALFFLILPWVMIILGIVFNIQSGWYFLLAITWFGSGIIFFNAFR